MQLLHVFFEAYENTLSQKYPFFVLFDPTFQGIVHSGQLVDYLVKCESIHSAARVGHLSDAIVLQMMWLNHEGKIRPHP